MAKAVGGFVCCINYIVSFVKDNFNKIKSILKNTL